MGADNLVGIQQLHPGSLWNTIYVLQDNQQFIGGGTIDLLWYRHLGYADGSNAWDGPRTVGQSWNFNAVFPCLNLLYAITDDGRLLWFHHRGSQEGEIKWEGPQPIGTSWATHSINVSASDFVGVFCDTRNSSLPGPIVSAQPPIIYAIRGDGGLLWYRHDGYVDGSPSWANDGLPKPVTMGWAQGYSYIFSGCNGIIYLIRDDGSLLWYNHYGYLEGTKDWSDATIISSGWGEFIDVFSLGEGIIYAIERDGTLLWFKHKGYQNGTPDWEGPRTVSHGWGAPQRVVCNSASLKTTHLG